MIFRIGPAGAFVWRFCVVALFGSNFIAFHDSGFRSLRAVVAAML